MERKLVSDAFTLGVCYYPEQWDEKLWEDDYRRMKEMGIDIVRVGEFAWTIFEPADGRFEFGLFDRALDLAHAHGLRVIMGTPTATPPAWLTHAHPEVLNKTQDGLTYHHGMRRHYTYNSPVYREYCARIVRRMAEHYRDHPAIVGWQIDNELNCETDVFYADADHVAFRAWLQDKYGTLEALNEAWGAVFWNQTYTAWEQVHLTRKTPAGSPNPHQALDEKRFISDSAISFAKLQSDIVREVAPHHWVTTNGLFGHLDSHRLTDETLDFFSYDSYPLFYTMFGDAEEPQPMRDRWWSLNLCGVRDISPNFCVMEQQAGPGGWTNRIQLPAPYPGQLRLWTYQSILHGADMVLYFRWRTATFGTEIYWHGLNDYHNGPNRRLREAAVVGEELKRIGARLAGRTYKADVALLEDYDNEWDGRLDTMHGALRGPSVSAWFKRLQYRHIPADKVKLRADATADRLSRYRLAVYPHPTIMTQRTAEMLEAYVRQGGILVLGARTGYKDDNGHCRMMPFPGMAAGLCGVHVDDFTLIAGDREPADVALADGSGRTFKAPLFNETLTVQAEDAEVVASYASGWFAGSPALTRRKLGQGEVWYFGAAFSEGAAEAILDLLELPSPAAEWGRLPREVEFGIRTDDAGGEWAYLLNYADRPSDIELAVDCVDVLTGERLSGTVAMPPFGVRILERMPR